LSDLIRNLTRIASPVIFSSKNTGLGGSFEENSFSVTKQPAKDRNYQTVRTGQDCGNSRMTGQFDYDSPKINISVKNTSVEHGVLVDVCGFLP
jgi:hypothetical protein